MIRFESGRIFQVILLMVLFGRIKFHCRQDLRHNRFLKFARLRQSFFGRFGQFFLIVIRIENGSAIRRSDVGKLSIGLGRVDIAPVNIQQLIVGNLRRIISYLDRFAVAGLLR